MASMNRIGTENKFVLQQTSEQTRTNENVDGARNFIQPATLEMPKSSKFLENSLTLPGSLSTTTNRKELFNEENVNHFIQTKVAVEDQIPIAKNLQTWIKSNFRLHAAQLKTVDNMTTTDLQTAETAAKRATELNTKIQVKLGQPDKGAEDQPSFEKNQLQMEQANDSVYLRFSGCKEQLMQQLEMQRNKGLIR